MNFYQIQCVGFVWLLKISMSLHWTCYVLTSVTCMFWNVSGVTNSVFPGAVHSRFEHSLGVYWLAGEAVQGLKNYQVWSCTLCYLGTVKQELQNARTFFKVLYMFVCLQGLELDIDRFDLQTVKIAGEYSCFLNVVSTVF